MVKLTLATTASLCIAGASLAEDIHVPGDYKRIQDAIDASVEGDNILVHAGTYSENIFINNRDITIVSADGIGKATIVAKGDGPTVFVASGCCGLTLNGFQIEGGYSRDGYGGGVSIWNAGPLIQNCTIANNTAEFGGGIGIVIAEDTLCDPVINNCNLLENDSTYHGGGLAFIASGQEAGPEIRGCTFEDNIAAGQGGGLYMESARDALVDNCTFISNDAQEWGGGIYGLLGSNTVVSRSEFLSNHAQVGGAISLNSDSDATINRCGITGNVAQSWGAGIAIEGADAEIADSLLVHNFSYGRGGGITLGQGNTGRIEVDIRGCTIAHNQAVLFGGGAFVQSGGCELYMYNTIIWRNVDSYGNNVRSQVFCEDYSFIHAFYMIISGGDSWKGLGGPIYWTSPRFIDPDGIDDEPGTGDEDYRILPTSPAIDAGTNYQVVNEHDLHGAERVVDDPLTDDTGQGKAPIVDIGCYEFQPGNTSTPGWRMWVGEAKGYFSNPENWFPASVPASGDTLVLSADNANAPEVIIYVDQFVSTDMIISMGGRVILDLYESDMELLGPIQTGQQGGDGAELIIIGVGELTIPSLEIAGDGNLIIGPEVELNVLEMNLEPWAVFQGAAVMQGDVANPGGRVLPGEVDEDGTEEPSRFRILGNYNQQGAAESDGERVLPAGSIEFDIQGDEPGEEYDVLSVEGSALLGGCMRLSFLDYTPDVGDTFGFLDTPFSTIVGNFDLLYVSGLPDGRYCRREAGIRGAGTGTGETDPIGFADPVTVDVDAEPADVIAADFDGDGNMDVAASIPGTTGSGAVQIFMGDGTGVLVAGDSVAVSDPRGLDTGDFDADGDEDIVVANYDSDTVVVLLNDGTGTFSSSTISTSAGPIDVSVADFVTSDANNMPDIAVACYDAATADLYQNTTTAAARGTSWTQTAATGVAQPGQIDPSDVGDTKDLDIVLTSSGSDAIVVRSINSDGSVPLTAPTTIAVGDNPIQSTIAELVIDPAVAGASQAEVITINADTDSISIIGRSGSSFSSASTTSLSGTPSDVAAGDFDGDGDQDLVVSLSFPAVVGSTHGVGILRNDTESGESTLVLTEQEGAVAASGGAGVVNSGDMNGDGMDDLITVVDDGGTGRALAVLLAESSTACTGDLDGNGSVDVGDLLAVIGAWGQSGVPEDLNGSGTVDVADLLLLIGAWGACP